MSAAASTTSARRGGRALDAFLRWREASIAVVAVLLVIYFESVNDNFITDANLQTLSQFIASSAIIACGEIMLLICGEIDLSAGQVFALAPFIMYFGQQAGIPLVIAILLALAASGLIGLVNGAITVKLRVPSFVTTLGTLFLINGFTLTISHGAPVSPEASVTFQTIMGAGGYAEIIWAFAHRRRHACHAAPGRAGGCTPSPPAAT